jgi:hypothetical protein
MLEPAHTDHADALKFYAARYALSGAHTVGGGLFRLIRALKGGRSKNGSAQSQTLLQAVEHQASE